MCGIAGAIGIVDDELRAAVRAMTGAQRHRGPDAEGFYEEHDPATGQGVVLGHRRLSIIDLRAVANQPMRDPESGQVLVFNGEIYDFRELRAELAATGVRFGTESDTEVLLQGLGRWGEACIERLRGMFAFAAWDPRARRLLLARDRLGIKPLYFAQVRAGSGAACLLFASELRALLASGLVPRRLDPTALVTYLWNGFVVGPSTMVRDVRLLPAGATLAVDAAALAGRERRYWQVPAAASRSSTPDELERALADAVRMRLVADVPLGVFLSGGIDSSAVASLAVAAGTGPVETFTIGFEEEGYDEAPFAREVARALGTRHHEIRLGEAELRSDLETAVASLDQPTFDAVNTWFVSRAARRAGITVALAGTGGDEVFGGYRSFAELPRARRWSRACAALPEPWLRGGARLAARLLAGRPGAIPPQTRWGKLGDALATRGDLLALYQTSYALFTREFGDALRSPAIDAEVHAGLPGPRFDELAARIRGEPLLHAVSILELALFLGERLLRDTDAASMAVSLEVRVPLIDHVVVETAAGIAERERFGPLGRKQLLRRLALGGLDPRLFERPKAGFVLPIEAWCRRHLREPVARRLADAERARAIGLEPGALARLWRAFEEQAPGLYWSRIWSLYVLLDWCERNDVRL